MKKEMLINVQPEESRVGILEDGVLEELYIERSSLESHVGNIYKGRIVNIESSIQAAFVDFGIGRNGFLHVSDVDSEYYKKDNDSKTAPDKSSGSRTGSGSSRGSRGRYKPPIQDIFRRGDEVLVQVIKEAVGTKGPTLSTYVSVPGRYLVIMPGLGRVGVSRKIIDEDIRRKLRDTILELEPPKGLGFIIRTAGIDRSKDDISRDMSYLIRLWKVIYGRLKRLRSPAEIYKESDLITRTIRDIFSGDIDTILIDDERAFERAKEFLKLVMPHFVSRLKLYQDKEPLFHRYNLEEEIEQIQCRKVPLRKGGSIVIDQTEALVAIDVNSGNFRTDDNAEETAYQINVEAAKEISRQLRLRDLGGVIVNDFIDMRDEKHRRGVERVLRQSISRDRARSKVLRMSSLGLIEMTRQRIRSSVQRSINQECQVCGGKGIVKTAESIAIEAMRILQLASHHEDVRVVKILVHAEAASYLSNKKRQNILQLEDDGRMEILISSESEFSAEYLQVICLNSKGNEVKEVSVHPVSQT